MEYIKMEHPDLPKADPAQVSRKSFEDVWERKGWQIYVAPPKAHLPKGPVQPEVKPEVKPPVKPEVKPKEPTADSTDRKE